MNKHDFKISLLRGLGLGLLAVLIASCSGLAGEPVIVATLPPSTRPPIQTISLPESAPDIANGAQIYAENCTRCHGVSGKGDGEMVASGQVTGVADFTDPTISLDAAPITWYEIVTNGRLDKLMPPWGDKLTDAQRWDVTLYVYTLAHTPEQLTRGKTIWEANCTECHGPSGEGTDKGAPLPVLLERTNNQVLTTVANGIPDKMEAFADKLSVAETAAVVAYARRLSSGSSAPVEVAAVPTAASAAQQPAATEDPNAASQPATTAEANAPVMGSVVGAVTNKTSGGTVPTDLKLSLYIVSGQNPDAPQDVLNTAVKPDGTYQFDNVPMGSDQHYVVMAAYGDAVFSSEMATGDDTKTQIDMPVSIYDISGDASKVSIAEMVTMMQVSPGAQQVQVVQIVSFDNQSDHAYLKTADTGATSTSVKLPAGAVFQDFSGGRYQLSADGTEVFDTEAVLPGEVHLMHLGYTLPYTEQVSIAQPVAYPLKGKVQVMIANNGLSITGDQFTSLGSSQLGDQNYQTFGGDFTRAAGESVSYTIAGSVAAPAATTTSTNNIVSPLAYILIAIGLVAIGTAIGFFMRERTDQRNQPQAQVNELMKQIADLDVRHKAGEISETQYQKQRTALKSQLMAMMKAKGKSGETTP